MSVSVVVSGRFHAFGYAQALYELDNLDILISTMPYSVAEQYGIPRNKYVGLPVLEILRRIVRRGPNVTALDYLYSKIFTIVARRYIKASTEVIVSFAGFSYEIFADNRFNNAIKILDRGSTHTTENLSLKHQARKDHGLTPVRKNNKFNERELEEYLLADYIMVPSDFVMESFIKHNIGIGKLIVNPYPADQSRWNRIQLRNVPTKQKNVILFVGQLSSRKGVGILLKAFARLRIKYESTELWLVGSPNDIELSNYHLEGVKILGVKRGEELAEIFQSASVFCLPSYEEGLALVLTEAIYFNLSIVATKNTGVGTVLEGNSFHEFLPGDEEGLAKSLESALFSECTVKNIQKYSDWTWMSFAKNLLFQIN